MGEAAKPGIPISGEARQDPAVDGQAPAIEGLSARSLFAYLLGTALRAAEAEPSPMALSYLIQLLEVRLRSPEPDSLGGATKLGLGEALLEARRDRGEARLRQLRALGDQALFVAGLFAPNLSRRSLDPEYVGQIGATAYGDLAMHLSPDSRQEAPWRRLFRELADDFGAFVDVLSVVGDRTRPATVCSDEELLDRYLERGREVDRRRLLARGVHLATMPPKAHRQ